MATAEQMRRLLAVACPWCGVTAGQRCRVRLGPKFTTVPSTLDGESHDARWRAAMSIPAKVLAGPVAERHRPQTLAASAAPEDDERPW